jgi:hypothetical protein
MFTQTAITASKTATTVAGAAVRAARMAIVTGTGVVAMTAVITGTKRSLCEVAS